MKLFDELGAEVERLWRDLNYDEEKFPALAAEALRAADLPSKLSAWDAVKWTLEQTQLPRQKDINAHFGEPPITLYTGPRFYIDIYVWLEGTTAIHQHSFCGAFQVLMGSSIHSWYAFEAKEIINSFMQIGEMSLEKCELLELNAIQKILAGKQYIHSLFHLDQPSVTLVVRTDRSPLFLPQFSYHKPSLAVDPFFEDETITKKLQVISALFRAKNPDTDRWISELLETSDLHTTFLILSTVSQWMGSDKVDQMFRIARPHDRFADLLEVVRKRHGDRASVIEGVFERKRQRGEIIERRTVVTDPEHRFFLALLLNVDGREEIFSLVKQRYPDSDPIEMVLDWVSELSETRIVAVNPTTALGIADFDHFDLQILEQILRDRTEMEFRENLLAEGDVGNASRMLEDLSERWQKVRNANIFQPLFL